MKCDLLGEECYSSPKMTKVVIMKMHGFSLIELMIAIAIIVILTMISVPTFMSFLTKAKRTEAYINLHALYAAQKAYWIQHGTYSTTLTGPGGIGWLPEGYHGGGASESFSYTYGFPGAEGVNYVTGKLGASSSYLESARADKNGFVAVAVADVDNDGKMDILTVNEKNVITVIQDDLE